METDEKTRIFNLARELNVESKDLLDLCRQAGFDVMNQLTSLTAEQCETVRSLIRRGGEDDGALPAGTPSPMPRGPKPLESRAAAKPEPSD